MVNNLYLFIGAFFVGVVAFTDSDCRPRASWLADLVPCLAHYDLGGGLVRPADDTTVSASERANSSLDTGVPTPPVSSP
ncbi:hypothetical protein DJ71_04685 [Halorubrum sp. E3]|nr:hypothetical protein DJ71_04685 [Halorubrum sp. E3]